MAQADFMTTPTFRTAAPKTRMTIYFALLIISLVAMIIACVFMFMEVKNFGGFGAVPGKWTSLERPSPMIVAGTINADTLARSASNG